MGGLRVGDAVIVRALSSTRPLGEAEGWWCDGMAAQCGAGGVVEAVAANGKVKVGFGGAFWWYREAALVPPAARGSGAVGATPSPPPAPSARTASPTLLGSLVDSGCDATSTPTPRGSSCSSAASSGTPEYRGFNGAGPPTPSPPRLAPPIRTEPSLSDSEDIDAFLAGLPPASPRDDATDSSSGGFDAWFEQAAPAVCDAGPRTEVIRSSIQGVDVLRGRFREASCGRGTVCQC
eukprot:TRINITY_DN15293_c0_g2_i1.p1 TRINITY_DN15293_c0_g2~~TRINITY_DN15293_c0_g2_i1.p1  ORF type:complete len:235 (+),score=47.48 TRINITY_DN15293_c0_g2_i1:56-760(+)